MGWASDAVGGLVTAADVVTPTTIAVSTADLDWRQTGEQSWNIDVETADGLQLALRRGGTELYVGGKLTTSSPPEEYEDIYVHFAELLRTGRSHVDAAPLQLVSDCFLMGRRTETEPFL